MYTPYYPQKQEVVRVSGANGANMFQLAPNSSILLLDETAPIVWLKTTDGAGYPTVTPYTITPYEPAPEINLQDVVDRLSRLEDMFNEYKSNAVDAVKAESNKSGKAVNK